MPPDTKRWLGTMSILHKKVATWWICRYKSWFNTKLSQVPPLQLSSLGNNTYGIYDPIGVRLLNRLRLGFSHLGEHKFRHNFADTLNPLCSCTLETEDTEHYFLHCQNNLSFRTTLSQLMNDVNNINTVIASLNSNDLKVPNSLR